MYATGQQTPEPVGPLPTILGVSGHRDLRIEDIHSLTLKVREIFSRLRTTFSYTPLILLSPLAEGADRLVAKVALDFGASVVAPLPMPREQYKETFKDDKSRDEFESFFHPEKGVDRWFELPMLTESLSQESHEAFRSLLDNPVTMRDLQYALVGAYIARRCQILIALWDGKEAGELGGTSQIVAFKRTGKFPIAKNLQHLMNSAPEPFWVRRSPLDPVETGPVFHIMTPRSGKGNPEGVSFSVHELYPESFDSKEVAKRYYDRMLDRLDRFNKYAIPLRNEADQNLLETLLPNEETLSLSLPSQEMLKCYSIADTLAIRFSAKTRRTLIALCILGFFTAFFLALYSHNLKLFEYGPWPLRMNIFVVQLATAIYIWSRLQDYQNAHQDYRAIAEGLRVQFFWRLVGLNNSVADHYLRRQMSELDWIRFAVRACSIRVSPEREDGKKIQLLKHWWIDSQNDYYQKHAAQSQNKLILYRFVEAAFLSSSILIGWLVYWEDRLEYVNSWDRIVEWAIAIMIIFTILMLILLAMSKQTSSFQPENETPEFSIVSRKYWIWLALIYGFIVGGFSVAIVRSVHHDVLIVTIASLAAAGGILHYYVEKRAYPEHAKQYQRIKIMFENAGKFFLELGQPKEWSSYEREKAFSVIIDLGKEALAENGDWVLLHRERPVELPKAGA